MAARKPRYSHRSVLRLEPSRLQATVGYSILTLLATVALVSLLSYRAGHWPERWPPEEPVQSGKVITAAWIVAAVLGLFLVAAVRNGRRWSIGNAVVRLSTTPTGQALLPDKGVTTSALRRATTIPYLDVAPVAARKLPRPRPLGQVDVTHNVTGRTPLRIGYLRIFENNARAKTFMHGAWREFGWVYLLRSATAVPPAEYREIVREGGKAFIDSPEAFEAEVQRRRPWAAASTCCGMYLPTSSGPGTASAPTRRWHRCATAPTGGRLSTNSSCGSMRSSSISPATGRPTRAPGSRSSG
jgi:hypothetical protein